MLQSSQKCYIYDDLDRLASDGDITYTYDAAGNRMTRTEDGETITYTLGVGDRLASYGRAGAPRTPQSAEGAYAYDTAGNVTRIERDGSPTLDLAWNSQYQLGSVSTNGVFAESYAYDALSRRVSTTTLEGTTRHVYDNNWQCIADIDEQGNVIASYTWGEGIDKLLAVTVGGVTYYPLTDIQGTVWGYVDGNNNVVARWQYDAWGNVLSEYVSPSAVALSKLRHRFQGREWSVATGLINFRMRWYDTETGRWMSKDPIGLGGGLNLYEFCFQNPILFSDFVGEAIWVGNRGLHQNINVGDPNGQFVSYSFGVDGVLGGFASLLPGNNAGVVYIDDPPDEMAEGMCMTTDQKQDDFARDFLNDMVGQRDVYRVLGPNCRHFSQSIFNGFKDVFKIK